MKEEWKYIKDYEGLYQISNLGRVFSLNKNKFKHPTKGSDGYIRVSLYKERERKSYLVHRLVAEAFIENPNNYPIINHKDENPSNNRVDNLEWCTFKYNNNYGNHIKNMVENNTYYKGSKHPSSRKVQCITTGRKFNCIKEAAEYYLLDSYKHISTCCKGKRNYCGKHPVTGEKLVWKYLDDK